MVWACISLGISSVPDIWASPCGKNSNHSPKDDSSPSFQYRKEALGPEIMKQKQQFSRKTAKTLDPPNESKIFLLCYSLRGAPLIFIRNPITLLQFPIDSYDTLQFLKISRKNFLCCNLCTPATALSENAF
jgi:hypothetical protein